MRIFVAVLAGCVGWVGQIAVTAHYLRHGAKQAVSALDPWGRPQVQVKPASGRKLFPWFDKLDFDAVRTGQFVKISFSKNWNGRSDYGFLSSKPGQPLSIITIDLCHLSKSPGGSGLAMEKPGFASFEPADLEKFATSQAHEISRSRDAFGNDRPAVDGDVPQFVMARACDARGLHRLAEQYLSIPAIGSYGIFFNGQRTWPNAVAVDEEIASGQMLEVDGNNLAEGESWSNRLEGYNRVVRLFGTSLQGPRARDGAEGLVATIAAENRPPKMPTDIDRLIWELTKEQAQQGIHPGECSIFSTFGGAPSDSRAHQLARFGYKAVPALIAALPDRRFTHCTGGNINESNYVLRVGDVALQILEEIASRSFRNGVIPMLPGEVPKYQARVLDWWSTAQEAGELADLKKGLLENSSPNIAEKLEKRYPKEASAVIEEALLHAKPGSDRASMIGALGSNLDLTAVRIVKREATLGVDISSRIAAATVMRRFDPVSSSRILIHEWKAYRNWFSSEPGGSLSPFISFEADSLIGVLANSESAECLNALADGLSKKSFEVRVRVLEDLSPASPNPAHPQAAAALEDLLVQELNDREKGGAGVYDGLSLDDPELGDLAARSLAEAFPTKYRFKLFPYRYLMVRQRKQSENVWRVSHGLRPLPLPKVSKNPASVRSRYVVTRVNLSHENSATARIAGRARRMKSRRLDWNAVTTLCHAVGILHLPQDRCVEIDFSRDRPNEGIVLSVDLDVKRRPPGSGGVVFDSSVVLNGAHLENAYGRTSTFSDAFSGDRADIESCLKAEPSSSFDIRFLIWPNSQG